MPVSERAAPLRFERIATAERAASPFPGLLLGEIVHGADGAATGAAVVAAPCIDRWTTAAASPAAVLHTGRCGSVAWRHDGHWLWGSVALDDGRPGHLEALTLQAYRDVFATLAETGCTRLLRVWNYLPRINADGGGLERYRQFNVGRQQAMLEAHYPAFEGAPAACALGTPGGPLRLHLLAGRTAPVAVENPRQVSAYRYPSDYGPRTPSFSRAALFDVGDGQLALSISGTASIVGHASVHPGDVVAQTHETVANLQAVIGAARARCSAAFALDALHLTVYVRDAADWPTVQRTLRAALGADAACLRDAVVLQADICRRELLVEVEAQGVAAGALRA